MKRFNVIVTRSTREKSDYIDTVVATIEAKNRREAFKEFVEMGIVSQYYRFNYRDLTGIKDHRRAWGRKYIRIEQAI